YFLIIKCLVNVSVTFNSEKQADSRINTQIVLLIIIYKLAQTKCYMLKRERHEQIMRQINLHNRVLTTDLVDMLQVSEDTIRRDLQELSESQKLLKVHGGALSRSYQSAYDDNAIYAREAK